MNKIFILIQLLSFFFRSSSQNTNSYQNIKDSIISTLVNKKSEIETNLNQLKCEEEASKCISNLLNNNFNCDDNSTSIEPTLNNKDLITINSTGTEISTDQCEYFLVMFKSLNQTLVKQISKLKENINYLKAKIFSQKNKIPENNLESEYQTIPNKNLKKDSAGEFFKQYAKNSDTLKTDKLNSNFTINQKINNSIIQQFDVAKDQDEIKKAENMKHIQRKLNVMITTLNNIQISKKKILSEFEKQKKKCQIAEKNKKNILNMTILDENRFAAYKTEKNIELNSFKNSACDLKIKEKNLCESFYEYCKNQRIKLINEKDEIEDFLLYLKE